MNLYGNSTQLVIDWNYFETTIIRNKVNRENAKVEDWDKSKVVYPLYINRNSKYRDKEMKGRADISRRRKNFREHMIYFYNLCLNPDLPFELIGDCDSISVFSKVDDVKPIKKMLIGILEYICDEGMVELRDLYHNSTFQDGKKGAVLFGPIKFCNHCCASKFEFNSAKQCDASKYPIVTIHNSKGGKVSAGKEIFICYARDPSKLDFVCECKICKKTKK